MPRAATSTSRPMRGRRSPTSPATCRRCRRPGRSCGVTSWWSRTRSACSPPRAKDGRHWAPLGNDLPPVATYSISLKPGDPGLLVAATFGRGVYTYRFKDPAPGTGGGTPCASSLRPVVRIATKRARASARSRRLRLRGTARGTACPRPTGVRSVQVAVQRVTGKRCRNLRSARGRFARRAGKCSRRRFLAARGRSRWSFSVRRRLPTGRYRVHVRAIDAIGQRGKARRITIRVR